MRIRQAGGKAAGEDNSEEASAVGELLFAPKEVSVLSLTRSRARRQAPATQALRLRWPSQSSRGHGS